MSNVSPFPPPVREERPKVDSEGVSWSEYVRTIEFADDRPPAADEAPVHVLTRVLFDGVLVPARIDKDGVTVDLSHHDGTIVTLWVHEEDVQIGCVEDETHTALPWLIGGRRVCTPVGKGWAWTYADPEDRLNPYVTCSFFVASIVIK